MARLSEGPDSRDPVRQWRQPRGHQDTDGVGNHPRGSVAPAVGDSWLRQMGPTADAVDDDMIGLAALQFLESAPGKAIGKLEEPGVALEGTAAAAVDRSHSPAAGIEKFAGESCLTSEESVGDAPSQERNFTLEGDRWLAHLGLPRRSSKTSLGRQIAVTGEQAEKWRHKSDDREREVESPG